MENRIIIGTRGSILAVAQAEKVKELLVEKYGTLRKCEDFKEIEGFSKAAPLHVEIRKIVTTGDRDMRDFKKIKGESQKDLFVKEIEKEMMEGKIHLAVHSLKDMPQTTPEGLLNIGFPIREDRRDVLISRNGKKLSELPENSVIGTGSIRREKELLNIRNDITVKPIRGNIHTRLKKLDDGEYDAIILAAAGLKRTGLEKRITEYFDPEVFMPAPGQGILCIQCRENDQKIKNLIEIINDPDVVKMTKAEREFSKRFNGGCYTPVGCSSEIKGDKMSIRGMYHLNGKRIFMEVEGESGNPEKLAQELCEKIKKETGENIE